MKQSPKKTTIVGGALFALVAVVVGGYLFLQDNVGDVAAATVRSAYGTIEAEKYDSASGVSRKTTYVTSLDNGDWIKYSNVDFGSEGATGLTAKLAVPSSNVGRKISVRLDSRTATPVGVLTTASTGGLSVYADQQIMITLTTGIHTVYLTFSNGSSAGNFGSFTFTKSLPVPPLAPSSLSATTQDASSSTNVLLSWVDNSTNETSFTTERSTDAVSYTVLGTLGAGVTTFTDLNVPDGVFFYRVKAGNSAGGSAYSNVASATVATLPQPDPDPTPTPDPTPALSPTVNTLTNAVPSGSMTAAAGKYYYFSIAVPQGASSLKINTTGGSGDDDFYVKIGSQPVSTGNVCSWNSADSTWRGATAATNESVTITNPTSGTYFITVAACSSITNVTITGTYTVLTSSANFTVNDRVTVVSGPANIRTTPLLTGALLGAQQTDALGTVTNGPVVANDAYWWNVNFDSGVDGWTTENFLTATTTPLPPPPVVSTCVSSPNTITPSIATQAAWDAKYDAVVGSTIPAGPVAAGADDYAWHGHYWLRAYVSMAKTYGDTKYLDRAVSTIDYWFAHTNGSQGWGLPSNPPQMFLDTGMIAQAISTFAYEVWNDARFVAYRPQADAYIAQLEPMLHTYDPQWATNVSAYPGSPSFYVYSSCGATGTELCSPASLVMYNQGATMAKALLLIDRTKRLKGEVPDAGYLDKADKAAAYFKTFVRVNGSAYDWDYGGSRGGGIEDTNHGHVDLSHVLWAYRFGLGGLTSTDMSLLSGTMQTILNSAGVNDVSFNVDGTGLPASNWDRVSVGYDWIDLVDYDPTLLDKVIGVYNTRLTNESASRFMLGWAEVQRKTNCISLF